MTDQDRNKFTRCLLLLAQIYGVDLTPIELGSYWICLRNYSLERVQQAILNYQRDPDGQRFMPKPSEIIQRIEGSSEEQALAAWTKTVQAIKHVGAYRTVIFDDYLIHCVIYDMGGWIEFCEMTEREKPFREQEFIKRYRGHLKRPPLVYPKQLTGLIEMQNNFCDYENNTQPMIIGDPKQAGLVYKNGQLLLSRYQSIPISKLLPVDVPSYD